MSDASADDASSPEASDGGLGSDTDASPTQLDADVNDGSVTDAAADGSRPGARYACGRSELPENTVLKTTQLSSYAGLQALEGSRLVVQDQSGHWTLWDTEDRKVIIEGDNLTKRSPATDVLIGKIESANGLLLMNRFSDSGVDVTVRRALDGQALSQFSASVNQVHLATDGSYAWTIWTSTGPVKHLQIWSLPSAESFTITLSPDPGYAVGAAGEFRVAVNSAAGGVVHKINVATGEVTVTPPYQGRFYEWFADGEHFLTLDAGDLIRIYSHNAALEQEIADEVVSSAVGGFGNYWWQDFSGRVRVRRIGATTADLAGAEVRGIVPWQFRAGVLQTTTGSVIHALDLRGPSIVSSAFPVPERFRSSAFRIDLQTGIACFMSQVAFCGRPESPQDIQSLGCGAISGVAGAPTGRFAVITDNGVVWVYDFDGGRARLVASFDHVFDPPRIDNVSISRDGNLMFVGHSGTMSVFSLLDGVPVREVAASSGFGLSAQSDNLAWATCANNVCQYRITDLGGTIDHAPPVTGSSPYAHLLLSPTARSLAVSQEIYQLGIRVGATSDVPLAWLTDELLLTMGGQRASVRSAQGVELRTLDFVADSPRQVHVLDANSFYSSRYDAVYSAEDGHVLGQGPGPGGIVAGSYVIAIQQGAVTYHPLPAH